MEYIIEQFNIDMRKASLYSKNAYAQYEFVIEEAFLESGDLYDTEYIITEAAGNLIEKIRAVFKKIIEAIKKFFQGLFEKIKSIFTSDKEAAIKEAIEKNPQIKNEKVQVPDIKEINEVCGKRFILRKKMIAECNKGTLTRDKFNQMIEHHEALGKKMKTVAIVTVTVAALAGGIIGISKAIGNNSKHVEDESISDLNGLQNTAVKQVKEEVAAQKDEPKVETKEQIPPDKVAQVVSKGTTDDESTKLLAEKERLIALSRKIKLANLRSEEILNKYDRRYAEEKEEARQRGDKMPLYARSKSGRYFGNINLSTRDRLDKADDADRKVRSINTKLGMDKNDGIIDNKDLISEYNRKYLKHDVPLSATHTYLGTFSL